jgi:hypothetical protein
MCDILTSENLDMYSSFLYLYGVADLDEQWTL